MILRFYILAPCKHDFKQTLINKHSGTRWFVFLNWVDSGHRKEFVKLAFRALASYPSLPPTQLIFRYLPPFYSGTWAYTNKDLKFSADVKSSILAESKEAFASSAGWSVMEYRGKQPLFTVEFDKFCFLWFPWQLNQATWLTESVLKPLTWNEEWPIREGLFWLIKPFKISSICFKCDRKSYSELHRLKLLNQRRCTLIYQK